MHVTKYLLVAFVLAQTPILAQDTPPIATPCSAPSFQKLDEFQLPACGASATETAKVSGAILLTDRTPSEIRQVILTRKSKMLAHASIEPVADNPHAARVSVEYSEAGETYQPPVDLVVVPRCGPVLSISIDRPGRCQ